MRSLPLPSCAGRRVLLRVGRNTSKWSGRFHKRGSGVILIPCGKGCSRQLSVNGRRLLVTDSRPREAWRVAKSQRSYFPGRTVFSFRVRRPSFHNPSAPDSRRDSLASGEGERRNSLVARSIAVEAYSVATSLGMSCKALLTTLLLKASKERLSNGLTPGLPGRGSGVRFYRNPQ